MEDYIGAHQMEYYAGWWWTSITDPVEIEPLARDRVEFCQDAEDFLEFVEDKLK